MCGVIGIIDPENHETQYAPANTPASAAYECYRGLLALQHRGQDAAGILSYDSRTRMFLQEKDLGLVTQVFNQEKIEKLSGHMAIGHTRYATMGSDGKRDIQPMVTGIPFGLGMVHNGNILNYPELAQNLASDYRHQLLTANDLEVLINYFGQFLLDGSGGVATDLTFSFKNISNAVEKLFKTVNGGYAALALIAGQGLVAFRDPKGIRPLVMGARDNGNGEKSYCLASETIAMTYLGYKYLRDIAPGEVVFIDTHGKMQSTVIRDEKEKAPCMFEWVYFSGAESTLGHQAVYGARLRLGERLAQKAKAAIDAGEIAPDVVMPVPDTSRPAAISAADVLGLPYREGLIKNRYVARSFILRTQEEREAAVELKLSPIESEIAGKRILLIDDSIVRGTTSKKIVSLLMKHGAKEVIFGVTCPPLRHACYYGIDFPDPKSLIANGKDVDAIAKWMGVSKVIYLDEEDLRQAIGISKLCMACLNGKYPTEVKAGGDFTRERQKARAHG